MTSTCDAKDERCKFIDHHLQKSNAWSQESLKKVQRSKRMLRMYHETFPALTWIVVGMMGIATIVVVIYSFDGFFFRGMPLGHTFKLVYPFILVAVLIAFATYKGYQ